MSLTNMEVDETTNSDSFKIKYILHNIWFIRAGKSNEEFARLLDKAVLRWDEIKGSYKLQEQIFINGK